MWSILLACSLLGLAQSAMIEWTAEEYPNPQDEPLLCGRYPNTPSFVCDPNGLIPRKSADFLDHILLNFQNDTTCPCSTYSCERREHSKGYIMAVALLRRVKHPENMKDTVENKKVLVHEFASKLLRQQWNKLGTCDEVVLIVFSKEDGILTTVSGSTPKRKLNYEIMEAIQTELARFFRDDGNVGQGLHYLSINYRRVLDGYHYYPIMYSDVPVHASASKIAITFLTSVLTTILLRICC